MSENEQLALHVANIIGPTSAAYAALMELRRRRAHGEDVELIRSGQRWIVAPSPDKDTAP